MSDTSNQHAAVLEALRAYTARNTISKEAAIAALTKAGFLAADGRLAVEYGGCDRAE